MPVGPVDVRVTIFDPLLAGVLTYDAAEFQNDFGAGFIKYEDTPSGCGAATMQLGLRSEDAFARGYYKALNIVEISTGDNSVTTGFSLGATKVYVDSNAGFDTSRCPDTGQAYFWDGATLTMRVPVTGIGTDGGGQYITIGAPLTGGSIPAYSAGTIVGRRRYSGRIVRVTKPDQKTPLATVTLVGFNKALDGFNGTWSVQATDVGSAIFQAFYSFSSIGRMPYFTVSGGNFPTVGSNYSGTNDAISLSRFVQNALTGVINGDVWALRIGHDRTPRLVKLYTASGTTYTYNVTLNDGVDAFEPQNIVVQAEDASALFNSVQVIGDRDATTKQPFRATVQDANSIAIYGQIDTTPVSNTQCKSVAACANYAVSLLGRSSLATSNNTFKVFTRNDNTSPVNQPYGMAEGDVVTGVTSVTLARFDGTGSVRNFVPDSEFALSVGGAPIWTDVSSGALVATASAGPTGGPNGHSNALVYTGTGSASANIYQISRYIDVVAGQVWTLSGYIDATHVTAVGPSGPLWAVWNPGLTTNYAYVIQTTGVAGRVSVTFTIPGGVTKIVLICEFNQGTVTTGQTLIFSQPQLERGNVATNYAWNNASPNIYGLVSSAQTTIDTHGDRWQDVKFQAIQPDWSASMAERANGLSTALIANTALAPALDQYFVSATAWPPTFSSASLVVTAPAFLAVFGSGSLPVPVGGNTFTLAANTTTWAWITPTNSWTLELTAEAGISGTIGVYTYTGSGQPPASGALLYGIFTTNGTGVIGAVQKCVIGLLNIPMPYMYQGALLTPTVTNVSITPGQTAGSITALTIAATITNQPTDGSLSKVMFYYRQGAPPGQTWLQLASSVPLNGSGVALTGSATSATGSYTAQFPDAALGVPYEFGIAMESAATTETSIVSLGVVDIGNGQNLIPDSGFVYAGYQPSSPSGSSFVSAIASTATYWGATPALDGTAWYLEHLTTRINELAILSADATGEHDFDTIGSSGTIAVTPGQVYSISCLIDESLVNSFATTPASTTTATRFDPRFWTVNGPSTAFGAVVTNSSTSLTATAELNAQGDLIGLQWTSIDSLSHELMEYATNNDYSGITLTFSYTASSNFAALSSVSVPVVITVTYTDNTVAYLYLKNYYSGSDYSATITLNFDTIHTGVNSSDPSWALIRATVIKSLSFGIISTQYVANSTTVLSGGTVTGSVTFSSIAVTSNSGTSPNASMTIGQVPSAASLGIGVADDYPDTGNLTPQRLIQAIQALGYSKHFDYYVGPSKHYSLHWNSGRGQYEIDSSKTINAAASAWFTDFLTRMHTAAIPCTLSVSMELLTNQIPTNWDQQDWNNNSAQTNYPSPGTTTLARFMKSTVRSWLISIFTAFTALIPSGGDVTMQIGEPAWWSGQVNGPSGATIGPCIFDFDTKTAYNTATGQFAVNIPAVVPYSSLTSGTGSQQAYVNYCGDQLGVFTDAVSSAIKTARSGTKVSVLTYYDAILGNGFMQNLNFPQSHWKASTGNYDVMEAENYSQVTPTFTSSYVSTIYTYLTGAEGSGYLHYANSAIRYYSGLATNATGTTINTAYFIPMLQAIKFAENLGFGTIILWAYTQVAKSGYMFGSLDICLVSLDGTTEYVTAYQIPGTTSVVQAQWTCPAGVTQVKARLRSRLTSPAQIITSLAGYTITNPGAHWYGPKMELGSVATPYTAGPDPSLVSTGAGSTGANLIPDSGWLLSTYTAPGGGGVPRTSTNPLWTTNYVDDISAYWEQNTSPGGSNSLQVLNASHDYYILSAGIPVTVGQIYTLSCYFDMTNFSGGPARAQITDTGGVTTTYATLSATAGSNGRVNLQWTCPGGVTSIAVKLDANSSARVSSAAGKPNLVFAIPQLEVGASMSPYVNGPATANGGVNVSSVSVPSGGLKIGGVTYYNGTGAPSFTANAGDQYTNTTGTTGSRLYINAGGSTWVAYA